VRARAPIHARARACGWRPVAVAMATGAAVTLASGWLGAGWLVPAFEDVRARSRPSDVWLLDRRGEPLHSLRVDPRERRLAWVGIGEVSPHLARAVVAVEDRRFGRHPGVDLLAVGAAVRARLRAGPGPVRGASTLSMQVASLVDPSLSGTGGRRSGPQKLRQALVAVALTLRWRREQVLEAYLNLAPVRGELVGLGAAAQGLFGREPSALDAAESWLFAALLARPNAPAMQVAARACRLARAGPGPVDCARLQALAQARLQAAPRISPPVALAPHAARALLRGDAPSVVSSLDRSLQTWAREAIADQLERLGGRAVSDAALLVVDNRSGEILAWVGNGGDRSSARHVDGVRAPRQAGSTLKPLLYQLALEQRLLTAASLLEDAPLDLPAPAGVYAPRNYDRRHAGWVSLRTALAGSLNVPAVRALVLVGPDRFADRLRRLGFADVLREGEHYGYSLALGSAEVRLEQLVNAYRTIANGGLASPLRATPLPAGAPAPGERVMEAASAFIVADILADRDAASAAFGFTSVLATRAWTAVKTGTSKDMRDNWCIGFSSRYTVGVWVGNFDGSPMRDVSGVSGAAPLWQATMERLHRDVAGEPPVPPKGLVQAAVRFDRMAAPSAGEPARREWFLSGTEFDEPMLARAPGAARIGYPGEGAVLALDPDIPAERQRVLFTARATVPGEQWVLGGERLGPADRPWAWAPRPGRHRLQLVDADGRVIDEVGFEVRGRRTAPARRGPHAILARPSAG